MTYPLARVIGAALFFGTIAAGFMPCSEECWQSARIWFPVLAGLGIGIGATLLLLPQLVTGQK